MLQTNFYRVTCFSDDHKMKKFNFALYFMSAFKFRAFAWCSNESVYSFCFNSFLRIMNIYIHLRTFCTILFICHPVILN